MDPATNPSEQACSENSWELHKKLGALSEELNDLTKSTYPEIWEEFKKSSDSFMKALNRIENGLPKDEEYRAALLKQKTIHQEMFEAFPDLLEERDRLTAAIAADYKARQEELRAVVNENE